MRSRIVLLLSCLVALAVATPAFAQRRQPSRVMPQQHFEQHFGGQRIVPQVRGGGYYYGGGYVVQPSQPYCYDANSGAFLHWGACYGNSWDYGVAPDQLE